MPSRTGLERKTPKYTGLAEFLPLLIQNGADMCSVLFCSVLFCSVLFCSVLFCSVLFYSILFYKCAERNSPSIGVDRRTEISIWVVSSPAHQRRESTRGSGRETGHDFVQSRRTFDRFVSLFRHLCFIISFAFGEVNRKWIVSSVCHTNALHSDEYYDE